MLQAIIEWLGGYTRSEENTKFKRLAVHKIEKAYLNYKSNQRVQKNLDSSIEIYKNVILSHSKKNRINHNEKRIR